MSINNIQNIASWVSSQGHTNRLEWEANGDSNKGLLPQPVFSVQNWSQTIKGQIYFRQEYPWTCYSHSTWRWFLKKIIVFESLVNIEIVFESLISDVLFLSWTRQFMNYFCALVKYH